MNIFERAVRAKLRFQTSAGTISTEDLFDLQLSSPNGRLDLDRVGRQILSDLKAYDEVSLVEIRPNLAKIDLQLKLEIVKHVIEAKKVEASAAETKVKNEARRHKLLEVLAKKQDASLEGMDEAQILAELESLNA